MTAPSSLLFVAGARPNFMKVAPLLREARARGIESVVVHTGQHYDDAMSGVFLSELGIGRPDVSLEVGSGSHAQQTGAILQRIEPIIVKRRPRWVVVVGDVNSTLAAALATAKLQPQIGCKLAHVEAGLRSFDWSMPEEVNRVVTDRVSDLLLTPSEEATPNLLREGVPAERIVFVGNVMVDSLLYQLAHRTATPTGTPYVLVTLHRPSNVDDRAALSTILGALADLSREIRVVFPLHPRTQRRIHEFGLGDSLGAIELRGPTGYGETVALQNHARAVITDSGGVQEETTVLGVPCLTLRQQTERPVTVTVGTNRLAPWPLTRATILSSARQAIARPREPVGAKVPPGWDGRAAERVLDALVTRE